MATNQNIIHAVQTIGITSASLVAGSNFATTLYAVPAILHSPPKLLAKQWLELYNRGIVVVVPLVIASTGAYSYLAYTASKKVGFMSSTTAQLYALAAALAISNSVFTSIVIMPTNKAITAIANSASDQGLEKVVGLVKKWDGLNMTRGYFVFAAAILGTWLTASRPFTKTPLLLDASKDKSREFAPNGCQQDCDPINDNAVLQGDIKRLAPSLDDSGSLLSV